MTDTQYGSLQNTENGVNPPNDEKLILINAQKEERKKTSLISVPFDSLKGQSNANLKLKSQEKFEIYDERMKLDHLVD